MVRTRGESRKSAASSPRASGGGPTPAHVRTGFQTFSPRERGWSARPRPGAGHQRGGGFSPRERGWSGQHPAAGGDGRVLPARAGVVQSADGVRTLRNMFSPRERGWSVALVRREVLADGSPRASGGGPPMSLTLRHSPSFSPRERGWSAGGAQSRGCAGVLPARAGVVRRRRDRAQRLACSPRASGGGPDYLEGYVIGHVFSPRERGWSDGVEAPDVDGLVLPARAGVVRRHRRVAPLQRRSPRASGGGPAALPAVRVE